MKIVGISGFSNTGKTTLVVELIKSLKVKGFTVSTMKGIHLSDFYLNQPDSDTWKHLQAGAVTAIARTQHETVQFWKNSLSFQEIASVLKTDFVLVEGMKKEPIPKILCAKEVQEFSELINDDVFALSGIIGNQIKSFQDMPVYNVKKDIEKLTELVMQHAQKIDF